MINTGFITSNHYPRLGGMEIAVHNLVKNLHLLEGVTASVACSAMPEVHKIFQYPYPCYRSKSFSILTPFLSKQNQLKMIRDCKVNILHGPMLHGGGFEAVKLAKRLNIPSVAHSRGADVQVVKEIGYGAQLDMSSLDKLKQTITDSQKIIAVSEINKSNVLELGASDSNVVVIPNGILIDEINAIPFNNLRPKYGLSQEDFVVISVGRNRPVKRIELLFAALKKLKSYKKIKCLCIGPKENLGDLAAKYNILDKVILTGKIPEKTGINTVLPYGDLINTYRSSNIYVSTSYVDAFSGASADALACGIPIIIGQKHGVRDIIKEGKTGWVMPKETATSLAEVIMGLYDDRERLKEKRADIKASVAHLTWYNIAKKTVEVYKRIL